MGARLFMIRPKDINENRKKTVSYGAEPAGLSQTLSPSRYPPNSLFADWFTGGSNGTGWTIWYRQGKRRRCG